MNQRDNGRRRFLGAASAVAGAGWLGLNAPALLAAAHAAHEQVAQGAPLAHLSEAEAETLAALVDQVIPPDDLPGAADVGVVHFVDKVLGDFMAGQAEFFRRGLAELDAAARAAQPGVAGFGALSFDQQAALLEQREDSEFFDLAIYLTHCGMFAMPSWGGNRDRAGWKMLGFDDRHAWQPPFGHYDAQAAHEATDEPA